MAAEPIRSTRAPASPSVVRAASLDRTHHRSFLADVVIEHGPRDVLGRLFPLADTRLREKGIFLSLAHCDELVAVNRANSDSWSPILPQFNPEVSDVGQRNCIALVGRNSAGRIVLAHASRHYPIGDTLLKDEIESLRLFYRDPERSAWPGERLVCTAPIAGRSTGNFVFTGALWLHPEYRGNGLTYSMMNIWRGLALTRWMPGMIFSFMVPELVAAGLAAGAHMDVDWEVTMINTPVKRGGTIHAGLNWTTPQRQLDGIAAWVADNSARRDPQIDSVINNRPRNKRGV